MATHNHQIKLLMTSATKRATPWLCFTAEEANSTIRLDKEGSPDPVSLETSMDGKNWVAYSWSGNTGATIQLPNVGDKVYWRATTTNATFSLASNSYYKFVGSSSSRYAVSGNLLSLLDRDCKTTIIPQSAFARLFQSSSYATSPYTEFSADLIPAAEVGATGLQFVFIRCGNARRFPDISRFNTLSTSSLYGTFTSSSVRELVLSDATPKYGCYDSLLQGCGSISHIKVGFKRWETSGGYAFTTNWCQDYGSVTFPQTGTFECPDELPEIFDSSHIPVGWTVDKPIKHYVQDGLVFQLDSKVGKASTTWTDIKNGVELNISGNEAIGNALDFPKGYTIEIVATPDYQAYINNTIIKAAFGSGKAFLYIRLRSKIGPGIAMDTVELSTNEGEKEMSPYGVSGNPFEEAPGLYIISAKTTGQTIYIGNGTEVTLDASEGEYSGTLITGVSYIKSIRVYDRALSADERAHNRQIDKERFG